MRIQHRPILIYRFIGLLAQAGADLSVYRFIGLSAQAECRFVRLSVYRRRPVPICPFIGLSAQAGADLSVYRFVGLSAQAGKNRPCHHAAKVLKHKDCVSVDHHGRRLCFGYNLKKCSQVSDGAQCNHGWHLCLRKGCHAPHPEVEHDNDKPPDPRQ